MKNENLEIWKTRFAEHVKNLQDLITSQLLEIDPNIEITEDIWQREDFLGAPGGGGITRAFKGEIFENAGVNTSLIFGQVNPEFANKLATGACDVWATGISLIIHPRNPKIPTVHANFRMIHSGDKYWFGGGADLTPYFPAEEDFHFFHKVWKDKCRPYNCYEKMKKTCDEYFVNHHREGEMRGIGGIFFDHYKTADLEKDGEMVLDISQGFIPSYFPIVTKRLGDSFSAEDEEFQLHRRGRYVEFNLLHDRGTMFGLKTKGRTDSILISLPARCKFSYAYKPTHPEHLKMMEYYFPKDW
jgi:coproporphyrinogen III oxidase